jgi:uncharacterized membrane protein SpoIIM required for sporulation
VKLDVFIAEREPDWSELDSLIRGARSKPEKLGGEKVRRLGELYRAAASDLATARAKWPADPVTARLEDLVTRGRATVYSGSERTSSILAFITTGYWRQVLASPWMLGLAWGLTLLGVGLGWLWAIYEPSAALSVMPAGFQGGPSSGSGRAVLAIPPAVIATTIFTTNIRVAFLAFAGGVTAGLLTAGLLVYNGLILGVLGSVAQQAGVGALFWSLIVPHGLLELSCIAAAAVAGFRLANGIVSPGTLPRKKALTIQAAPAVKIAIGTAALLVIAGIIEGFVTPQRLPLAGALGVGVAAASLFWVPLFWRGRTRSEPSPRLGQQIRSDDAGRERLFV